MSAGPISLSPSSYVVLGLIALHGPMTPYDLKRAAQESVAYFWVFPHSQLYVEPDRLAKLGLLTENREEEGRRRRTFDITPVGRQALDEWLADPTAKQTEIRDFGLLKLFFGRLTNRKSLLALAQEQIRMHQARLDEYQAMDARRSDATHLEPDELTLWMGLNFERAVIDFWGRVHEYVAEQPARKRTTSRR